MKRHILILSLLIPLLGHAEILEGVAKNKKGEIVYLEKHAIEMDSKGLSQFIQVQYTRPDGTAFANMTSDFSKSKTLPETTFEDTRFKTKSLIRLTKNSVEFEEFKNDKIISKKSFPFKESMVASQGFDNFIQLNADKIDTQPVEFNFGVLESKDFFTLTGYRKPASSPNESEYGIKASNWFFRLFADELKVVYDSKTKKLKSFTGRSNVPDDSGKPQDVIINYQWKD